MKLAGLLLAGLMGGLWGFGISQAVKSGDYWGAFLMGGLLAAVFYVVIWMVDLKYHD